MTMTLTQEPTEPASVTELEQQEELWGTALCPDLEGVRTRDVVSPGDYREAYSSG